MPSLDGSIYKYDPLKKRITPLPVNVNTLINQAGYLDPVNVINGGKIKIIHGIDRLTGEVNLVKLCLIIFIFIFFLNFNVKVLVHLSHLHFH